MAKMDGLKFEEYCANILRSQGYKHVKVTKASGDQGVDVLAFRKRKKYAIQCKYYSEPVSNTAVQEVLAGKLYYKCDEAIVMTNSTFTQSAKELAEKTGVELWDKIKVKRSWRERWKERETYIPPIQDDDDTELTIEQDAIYTIEPDYEKWVMMEDSSPYDVRFGLEKTRW